MFVYIYMCVYVCVYIRAAAAKSRQSCPTLCDPIDGSPPGSPVPGILQARTLEWAAISFSSGLKWKVKVKSLSHIWLSATPWTAAYQTPPSMGFSRQEYWSGVPLPSLVYIYIYDPMDCSPGYRDRPLCSWDFPGENTGVGCHFLLQGIFSTQGPNPHFLHCMWILHYWATREELHNTYMIQKCKYINI